MRGKSVQESKTEREHEGCESMSEGHNEPLQDLPPLWHPYQLCAY